MSYDFPVAVVGGNETYLSLVRFGERFLLLARVQPIVKPFCTARQEINTCGIQN